MNSGSEHEVVSGQKSAQQYIDETPLWADGTALQTTPMTGMQWRIWTLAAAAKFLRGTRCLHDRRRHAAHRRRVQNNSGPHGVVGAASLFGILVGAVSLGSLVGTSLLGAIVTWAFRIETTGISLETIER